MYGVYEAYYICPVFSILGGMLQAFYVFESAHVAALIRHVRRWRGRGEVEARHATIANGTRTYLGGDQPPQAEKRNIGGEG